MHRTLFIIMSICVCAIQTLHAQATADTGSFRRGQWGVDFVPSGTNLAEAGVLRFSTPTRAWVLDGSAAFGRDHVSGTNGEQIDQTTDINARIGPRWYHNEYERVVQFLGLGVTGGYSDIQASPSAVRTDGWNAGAYGELGLQYLFTRHLGLGGRGQLVGAWYGEHSTGGNATQRVTSYRVALQPIQIIGSFYF